MKLTDIMFLAISTIVGLSTAVDANTPEPAIGKSFFLPKLDIAGPLRGGKRIFKEFNQQCYITNSQNRQTVDSRSLFENSEAFYNSIATSAGISAKLTSTYTMGATLSSKTQSLSRGSTDVQGTSINIWSHVKTTYLDSACYRGSKSQLTDELLTQLDYLQSEVKHPELKNSWRQYENFLLTYGSHFVSQVHYGASVKQWTFTKKEKRYSQRQLNLRSCADFSGWTSVGNLNVKTCSGVTKENAQSVKNLDMSSKLELRGGSDATRNRLRYERTEGLITKLLNEGRQMETPVAYKFIAIWDILKMRFYNNPRRHAIAMNLQQYFEGYLDFGCTLKESGGLKLRRFQRSRYYTKDNPEFECVLEKAGCHTDDDCTIGGWGTATYCYGSSCVEHVPAPFGSKAKSAKIRRQKEGSYNEGINKSCYYAASIRGKCHKNWAENEVLWSAGTKLFQLRQLTNRLYTQITG